MGSVSDPVVDVKEHLGFAAFTLRPSVIVWWSLLLRGRAQGPCWAHFLPGLWPAYLTSRALGGREPGKGNALGCGSVIQEGTQEGNSCWALPHLLKKLWWDKPLLVSIATFPELSHPQPSWKCHLWSFLSCHAKDYSIFAFQCTSVTRGFILS